MAVRQKTRSRQPRLRAKTAQPRVVSRAARNRLLLRKLEASLSALTTISRRISIPEDTPFQIETVKTIAVLRAIQAIASAFTLGECELDRPFSQLKYVRRKDGVYMCCNHKTQHCTKIQDATSGQP